MKETPILQVNELTKRYGATTALEGVSVAFRRGEVHALVGENGAGKSTLSKIIAGAVQPTEGTLTIKGQTVTGLSPMQAKKLGISMVYQEFNLVPELPVYENLFIGKELRNGPVIRRAEMIRRSQEIFETMGVTLNCESRIKDLSVAYCQLVEIAKALLDDSEVLILDEPTAPITNKEVEMLFRVVRMLREKGILIIYISHRLDEIFEICDRITVLRDAHLVRTLDVKDTCREELIAMMIGRELTQEFPPREADYRYEGAQTVLKAEHLTNKSLKDVSFELKQGEILGIAGLVGAGRTELLRAVFGADRIVEGTVTVHGNKVKLTHPKDAIKNGIALIPEDRKREGLMLFQPIAHNMTITIIKQLSHLLMISQREEQETLERSVQLLSIKNSSLARPVSDLSGGNQQTVVLAKWLSTSCDILLFDEPTRGIDVGAKKEIYDFLFRMKQEGKSIIMVSSEMSEILNLSDRILVMHEGRVQGQLLYQEATQEKILSIASGYEA